MRNKDNRNIDKAFKKLKSLQKFLNKHFPEDFPFEKRNQYKFVEAEDFLREEARLWNEAKKRKD